MTAEDTDRTDPLGWSRYTLSDETKEGLVIADVLVTIAVLLEFLAPLIAKAFDFHSQIPHFGLSWWALAALTGTFWHTPPMLTDEMASRRADRKMLAAAISIVVCILLAGVPLFFPAAS